MNSQSSSLFYKVKEMIFLIPIKLNQSYWIGQGKTDLRKGIDTFAVLLQHEFDQDPFDGSYYFFCGTRSDRFKVLHWDGEGFQLIYKRLKNGEIYWPKACEPQLEKIQAEEVSRLLAGLPIQSSIQKSSKKLLF